MSISINLKDLTNLGQEIEKAIGAQIITEAKKAGIKAESKSGQVLLSGEESKIKKFIQDISK